MSQTIQFLESAKSGCKAPVLPIVVQEDAVVFNTALDGTAPTVIGPIAAGDPAPYGGLFVNKGCEDLTATITYLGGGDCDQCNDEDTLVPTDIVFTIPANSATPIPDGFWTGISYVLAAAANDSKKQTVSFQSCYTPDCPSCTVLVPGGGK